MLKIEIIPLRCMIDCLLNEGNVFRMNSLEYQINRRLAGWFIIFKDPKSFFRPKAFSARYTPAETAGLTEFLGFRQVRFLAPQLLRHALLLRNIHERADETRDDSVLPHRLTNATNNPQLAIRSDDALFEVAADAFRRHSLDGSFDDPPVFRVHNIQIVRDGWDSFCRVKTKNMVQLLRPVITDSGRRKRPTSGMSKSLPLIEIKGGSL